MSGYSDDWKGQLEYIGYEGICITHIEKHIDNCHAERALRGME